jgi:hypothetical protein
MVWQGVFISPLPDHHKMCVPWWMVVTKLTASCEGDPVR